MPAAVAVTPTAATATKTVHRVDVTGTVPNDPATFNASNYPTETENRFYLAFEVGGVEKGRSQVFGTTPVGAFTFNSYIFPTTGTYTVNLRKVSDNSSVATASVVVS